MRHVGQLPFDFRFLFKSKSSSFGESEQTVFCNCKRRNGAEKQIWHLVSIMGIFFSEMPAKLIFLELIFYQKISMIIVPETPNALVSCTFLANF